MAVEETALVRIEVIARWTGFARPSSAASLTVVERGDAGWVARNEMSLEEIPLAERDVQRLIDAVADIDHHPEPSRFGRTRDELDWHFGSASTDDYPELRVDLHYQDGGVERLKTRSNHAHLLPWRCERSGEQNFNPEVSGALAGLLPDSALFKQRLASADGIFESEAERRAEFQRLKRERADAANLDGSESESEPSFQQQMDELNTRMRELSEAIAYGERVAFEEGRRDYTANQVRCMTLDELRRLAAAGFDLSTSDETGQTALMLAASPPFSHDQFANLVAAGADVDARRTDSTTGLMQACAGGMEEAADRWLAAGASVDLRGPNQCTALMLAAQYPLIVKRLLEHGANPAAADGDGDTALDYAMEDITVLRAGARLESIELLAGLIASADRRALERSLQVAREAARQVRVHERVLEKLGHGSSSAALADLQRGTLPGGERLPELDEYFDLEITEVELADRMVEIIDKVLSAA